VYDLLLLAAVLFVATALVLPFTGGQAVGPHHWIYTVYLLAVTSLFFGWSWTHGGQTLGMKAWHLKIRTIEGGSINWRRAAIRMLAACLSLGSLGLGYLWILVDRDSLAWHDRLSGTRITREPPPGS
jgi:uncharacterized RDD family membrane protein YckC